MTSFSCLLLLTLFLGCKGKDTTAPVPTISACSPATFQAGSVVTLTGSAFTGAISASIGGVFIPEFTVVDDAHMTCTIPSNAVSGSFTVSSNLGNAFSALAYMVQPVLTGISPSSGPPGTPVTLSGSGFVGTTQVLFGTEVADSIGATTFIVDGPNQITAIVGINATSATPSITSSGLSSVTLASPAPTFTVTAPN